MEFLGGEAVFCLEFPDPCPKNVQISFQSHFFPSKLDQLNLFDENGLPFIKGN